MAETKGKAVGTAEARATSAPDTKMDSLDFIPGYEILGCGYDVFGLYAHVGSQKARIFDFEQEELISQRVFNEGLVKGQELAVVYKLPKKFQFRGLFQIDESYTDVSTVREQSSQISANLDIKGSYGLFSAEVQARYDKDQSFLSTARAQSLSALAKYYILSLDNYSLSSPPTVRAEVQQDLDSDVPASAIFEKYGTHYIQSVTMGCSVVISVTVDSSKVSSSTAFSGKLVANYGGPSLSAGVEAGASDKETQSELQKFGSNTVHGRGLSDQQIDEISQALSGSKAASASGGSGDPLPVAVLKGGWQNPTLIDFPEPDSLKPIWELCTKPERKQALEKAFTDMENTHAATINGYSMFTPIYEFRSVDGAGKVRYRIDSKTWADSGDGLAWKIKEVNGEVAPPIFYIFSEPRDGCEGLVAYYSSNAPNDRWYLTASIFDALMGPKSYLGMALQEEISNGMAPADSHFKPVGDALGYVYVRNQGECVANSVPVYFYQPRYASNEARPDLQGLMLSPVQNEARDNAGWILLDEQGIGWQVIKPDPKYAKYYLGFCAPDVKAFSGA